MEGTVQATDRFGNLISNIPAGLLPEGARWRASIRGRTLSRHQTYADVPPGEPVVRVKLLTGRGEHFATSEGSGLSEHALWWPPGKVAGAYLTPYLAGPDLEPPPGRDVHDLEIPLRR